MKYDEIKDTLRKGDPEFDQRVKAERLRVDLAVALAQRREQEGYSQRVIAEKAQLTQQQVSRIENAENCTIDTYLKVMVALGLEYRDIAV